MNIDDSRNCSFHRSDARTFSAFVSNMGLIDLPLVGSNFTWYGNGGKASRIDRILTPADFLSCFGLLTQRGLPKMLSDHWPTLLSIDDVYWGARPLRFINAWTDHEDFLSALRNFWDSYPSHSASSFSLWFKLKSLGGDLKA